MRTTREVTQQSTPQGVIYTDRAGQEFDLALHPKVLEAQRLHKRRLQKAARNRKDRES